MSTEKTGLVPGVMHVVYEPSEAAKSERARILALITVFPEYDETRNGFAGLIEREALIAAIKAEPP